jgi:hypothetical protein
MKWFRRWLFIRAQMSLVKQTLRSMYDSEGEWACEEWMEQVGDLPPPEPKDNVIRFPQYY